MPNKHIKSICYYCKMTIIEKYLKKNVERKWLEDYILNGNLTEEYLKPYLYENFTINE